MRKDISRLLRKNDIDGVLVMDGAQDNPNFKYVTANAPIKGFFLHPARGKPAILYGAMERDNLPGIDGLRAFTYGEIARWKATRSKRSASRRRASGTAPGSAGYMAAQVALFLERLRFRGRLCLAGKVDAGFSLAFARMLDRRLSDVKIVFDDSATRILKEARSTKDDEEIALIAKGGKVTERAIAEAVRLVASGRIRRGRIVDHRGRHICIGHVRERILKVLADGGMSCPETPIVAQGEEAAVPHNTGTDSRPLVASSPLVLDVFPRMEATGYFFDTTRTICPGRPSPELARMYRHVLAVHRACCRALAAGVTGEAVNSRALDMFESWGYPTIRTAPGSNEGFCHGLGHGLGLEVHEWPNVNPGWPLKLARGSVVTIEPGLYFPDRGIGIRIEDVLAITPDGRVRNLCRNGKRFHVPLEEA